MNECVSRMKAHGVCLLPCVSMWERHVTHGGKLGQLLNLLVAHVGVWVLIRSVYPTYLPIKNRLNLTQSEAFGWFLRVGG